MKNLIVNKYGGPEKLILNTLSLKDIPSKYVKIKVSAAGVNYADLLIIQGKYQERPRPPFSPGLEISGTIIENGVNTSKFKEGSKVMAIMKYGGYTEEIIVPEENVYSIPKGMNIITAAGFPVVYGTAYAALMWKAKLKKKETCLILGASGGVGIAAIEIAKAMGAKVIAAASSEEKLSICKIHGADYTINYKKDIMRNRIKEISSGGIDVVIDLVGGNDSIDSIKSLSWEGRIVIVGFATGSIPSIPANRLLLKNAQALGLYWGEQAYREPKLIGESFKKLEKWYINGLLKPRVYKKIKLKDATKALNLLKDRKNIGKIVLTC